MRDRFKLNKIYDTIHNILCSRGFIAFIIVIFILQSLWIAFSFRYPMLYDEAFHLNVTKLYSQQISPIIMDQPEEYDIYGRLSHGGATIFHYFMSFPYRLINLFTDNLATVVISLRVLCVLMAAAGVWLYYRLFKKIGVNQGLINIGLLLFIMLPIVPFVSATVNYDNLLFPLTALFFIISADILNDKRIEWRRFVWFFIVGFMASLVKFTFLPVFAIGFMFVAVVIYRRYKFSFFSKFYISMKKSFNIQSAILIFILLTVFGLFSSIYLYNLVAYKSINPKCELVMSQERCEKGSNYIRNTNAEKTKETREPIQNPDYISLWTVQMANWTAMTGSRTSGGTVISDPLPVIYNTIYIGGFLGLFIALYTWKSLKKNIHWYYLLAISISLVIFVFLHNFMFYHQILAPYAIQPRYLITAMPIFAVIMVLAANKITKNHKNIKLSIIILMMLLLSQGGGVMTHIINSDSTWYWDNNMVLKVNEKIKSAANLIYQSPSEY